MGRSTAWLKNLLLACLVISAAPGATLYWHPQAASTDGNLATNWTTDQAATVRAVAIDVTDALQFNGSGANHNAPCTLTAGLTCAAIDFTGYSVTFNDAGFTLTVNGNATFVSGMTYTTTGGLTMGASGTLTTGARPINNLTANTGTLTLGDALTITGSATIGAAVTNGGSLITINSSGSSAISGAMTGAGGLTKSGAGTLTLSGANNYAGATIILGGTLACAASNTLPTTGRVIFGDVSTGTGTGTLDLGTFSQTLDSLWVRSNSATANHVTIGSGGTLTINGTGGGAGALIVGADLGGASNTVSNLTMSGLGALAVNSSGGLVYVGQVQGAGTSKNTGTLDLTGLASVTLGGVGARLLNLHVGYSQMCCGVLLLSNTANSINATTLDVGRSTNKNSFGTSQMILGTGTNALAADIYYIGMDKGSGTVAFASQVPASPGAVTISGATIGATVTIAGKTGGISPVGVLDLRGHNATVTVNDLVIGSANDTTATGNASGTLSFDAGTFTVNTVKMGVKSGTGTGSAQGTLNIGGGTFTVNAAGGFSLASQIGTVSTATSGGTLAITGGTVNVNAALLDGGGTVTSTLTLDGGTLDMKGFAIGGAIPLDALNLRSGTLKNVAQINNGGAIAKTTGGILVMGGTNGHTGATTVSAGTLEVDGSQGGSAVSVNGGTLRGTGTVGALTAVTGTVAPGTTAPSHAALSASTADLSTCATTIRIAGYRAGTDHDRLACSGALTLGGTSVLNLDLAGLASAGTAVGIITCSGMPGGVFTTVNVSNNPNNYQVSVQYAPGMVNIACAAAGVRILYWNPQAASTDGNAGMNWTTDQAGSSPVIALAVTDALYFNGLGANHDHACTLTAGLTCTSIDFTGYGGTFTDAGCMLTVDGSVTLVSGMTYATTGGLTMGASGTLSTGTKVINNLTADTGTLTLGDALTVAGTATVGAAVTNDGFLITIDSGGASAIGGAITGNGGLTKNGSGTLTLGGTNAYTGATTVGAGTLLVNGSTAAGSAVAVAGNATLGGIGTVAGAITLGVDASLSPGTGGSTVGHLAAGSVACTGAATGSAFRINLDGATADSVTTAGDFSCAGNLVIATHGNVIANQSFPIISAGTRNGTFTGLPDQAVFTQGGRTYGITYSGGVVTITDSPAPRLLSRQTIDSDGNGRIDRIRLTFDQNLNDLTGGLTVAVAGYTVFGYATGTAHDAVLDVVLTESGTADTGATPAVRIAANTTLAADATATLVAVEGSPTNATDAAPPVLLSATWNDGDASTTANAGDTVVLAFSENVTTTATPIAAFALPVTGDSWGASTGPADATGATVTLTLAGAPVLTPGGSYLGTATTPGHASGVYVADGGSITDAVALPARTGDAASARDLASLLNTIAVVWTATSNANARSWNLDTMVAGAARNTVTDALDLGLANRGDVTVDIQIKVAASSPSGWTPAADADQNIFLAKAHNGTPADPADPALYALTLTQVSQDLKNILYPGLSTGLNLYFRAPTSLTVGGGRPQSITITLTARTPP